MGSRERLRPQQECARACFLAALLFAVSGGVPLSALREGRAPARWPDVSAPAPPAGGGGLDAAVIVAVEDYRDLPRVQGAGANAWAWFDHFNKTRGVPGANVLMLLEEEATAENVLDAAERASGLAGAGGTLWFVFVGRGAPDAFGRMGLMPADARKNGRGVLAPVLSRRELLSAMSGTKAGTVAAVLDACAPAAAGPAAGGADPVPDGRFVYLACGRGADCAGGGRLKGAPRPALSYLALGALRGWADADGNGKITAAEMLDLAAAAFTVTERSSPVLAGDGGTVLGVSPGETGPDMARAGEFTGRAVNSGLFFRAGIPPAVPPGVETRSWTRDTDWNKLSRMLSYAGGAEEKRKLASAFIKAYGPSAEDDPYVVYLLPFLDMALIPSGGFEMGSPHGEGEDDEHPRRTVYLDAFSIDKREVTAAGFRAFCEATKREMPEQPEWSSPDHPVVNVDWDSAAAYCEWAGKRLPTEAEWEKAARGGSSARYPFGDDESGLGDYAWHHGNSGGTAHPVGLKKPNQYGLYDMLGNAWEWAADRYGASYYRTAPPEDPKGPGSGPHRVRRGGSWNFFDVSPRPGDRGSGSPSSSSPRGGFRCVF